MQGRRYRAYCQVLTRLRALRLHRELPAAFDALAEAAQELMLADDATDPACARGQATIALVLSLLTACGVVNDAQAASLSERILACGPERGAAEADLKGSLRRLVRSPG